jgi:membrane-bound lytic murein transglycosylase B
MRRANAGLGAGVWLALACATTPHPNPPAPAVAAPPVVAATPAPGPASVPRPDLLALEERVLDAKGWSWLVGKLAADGVPRERAARAFADARMPAFEGLFFSPDPAEPRALYRAVLQRRSIAQARACRDEHARAFEGAEARTGVPAEVVAAILHVETRCGRNTGDSLVLFGLARLAMANEPDNLERNLDRRAQGGFLDPALEQRVRARAATLEDLFYPEVRGVFELAELWGRDPLSLRGSASGAFGFPQFLPTSYLRFGADGNGDGRVDLYDVDDAATSAAWFLVSHGWQGRLERGAQRRVLWHYNRSDAYIDAVLGLAAEIGPGPARASVPVVEAAH